MTIGTLFTLFVTPAVYTYLARDHQKAKEKASSEPAPAASTPREKAGVLFPGEAEPMPSDAVLSSEAHAFSSAAAAAADPQARERPSRRRGRRKRYPQAAE
jgi:hypothetical protein